jgi:hypothetical protein
VDYQGDFALINMLLLFSSTTSIASPFQWKPLGLTKCSMGKVVFHFLLFLYNISAKLLYYKIFDVNILLMKKGSKHSPKNPFSKTNKAVIICYVNIYGATVVVEVVVGGKTAA